MSQDQTAVVWTPNSGTGVFPHLPVRKVLFVTALRFATGAKDIQEWKMLEKDSHLCSHMDDLIVLG